MDTNLEKTSLGIKLAGTGKEIARERSRDGKSEISGALPPGKLKIFEMKRGQFNHRNLGNKQNKFFYFTGLTTY